MKKWAFIAAILGLTASASFTAFAGEWVNDSKGWWFQQEDGRYPANTWQEIDRNWFYFDQNGYMKTGWLQCNGNWYYCDLNGKLTTNQWLSLNGVWYYLREDGTMVSDSWYEVDGKSYYFGSDGAMYEDTRTPDENEIGENGNIIVNSKEKDRKEKNTQTTKTHIVGTYEYDEGVIGGYYDGRLHYGHIYTLVLNEDNTFEYTYDNSSRVYNESGTYTYDARQGIILFSDNPYISKGLIKDGGILISEYTDGNIFFALQ